MTDRELLELAAKAAGMDVHLTLPADGWTQDANGDYSVPWNPLTDDGDAFRLAMKCRMSVDFWETGATVTYEGADNDFCDVHERCDDAAAATRRAVVRAAAAIGETK